MASKEKKGKGQKDADKKGSKKSEDTPTMEEKKEETPQITPLETPAEEPVVVEEEPPPKEPTPEPVYDEPSLAELIIECFEGEIIRGLYEGEGEASFAGGHHYKGNFSEGMMHGRGMYTWANGMVYEGEFFRNQVTGKGIYRWTDGSSYEGDVSNGLRHGTGTFYCANGQMSYSGNWCQGKRHGKGRMDYNPNGTSFYDGEWVNNIRHGWGTRGYPSGNVYQGMWFNNVRHGEGTMRWLDRDQMYSGQWEDGIQHGMGQHIWFLRRVAGSQYPLRNMYDGEFVKGLRHGIGVFYYANGARFEGIWRDNMKHGKGKFIFKNGRVYEGMFEKDHIVEYPSFTMDSVMTPDLSQIRTRTPLPMENMSIHSNESRNTMGPTFQLEIEHLLTDFAETDRENEQSQTLFVIMRYMTIFKRVYVFYSSLGFEDSPDNTFIMNRMQFWRFLKDCRFHHHDITLTEMDRALAVDKSLKNEIHNPYNKILFREYVNHIVTLSYLIYSSEHEGSGPLLPECLSKLITEHILKYSCSVQGYIYFETRRAVNALVHMDQAYQVYQAFSTPRKYPPYEPVLTMRQFLFMIKDLKLINGDLTAKDVLEVLSHNDPAVSDGEGAYNLELEMTFLEFFEALVGCAQIYVTEAVVKDPNTPRPSTTLTQEQSILSLPASPSRGASQAGLDDGQDDMTGHAGSPGQTVTPETTSPVNRNVSSAEMTQKTAAGDAASQKPNEQHQSNTTTSEAGGAASLHTHPDSAGKGHSDALLLMAEQKKSASFMSSRSNMTEEGQPMMHSMVSMMGHSETAYEQDTTAGVEGEEEELEEELDEATRLFNFWTHQVHIFFVRKFFPAAERHAILKHLVDKFMIEETARQEKEAAARCDMADEVDSAGLLVPEKVVMEKPPSRLLHATALASLASDA